MTDWPPPQPGPPPAHLHPRIVQRQHALAWYEEALRLFKRAPASWVALALIAVFLACSRVYLSQHFTEDVLAGALIGTSVGVLGYWWLYRSGFSRRAFLDARPFRKK